MGTVKRKKKCAREPSLCLICLVSCSNSLASKVHCENSKVKNLEIPGAGNCLLLNKQLEQLFIVQKLLDVPREKCQDILSEQSSRVVDVNGKEESEENNVEGQWFVVCDKCTKTCVEPAWSAYQKLLAAETEIRGIKEKIKDVMREQILKRKMNKVQRPVGMDGVDNEIRRCVFPDLLLEPDESIEEVLIDRPRPSYRFEECGDEEEENSIVFSDSDSPSLEDPLSNQPEEQDVEWDPLSSHSEGIFDDAEDFFSAPLPKSRPNKRRTRTTTTTTPRLVRGIKKRGKRKPRDPDTLKRFRCLECGCYFHSPEQLNNHVEAHEQSKQNGGGPYDCDKCSYPARTPEELQFHLKNRHGRVRFHECPKCGLRKKNWKQLKAHLTSVHADEITQEDLEDPEISLKCPVCDRQFERLESFTIHKRKMHPELFGAETQVPVECPTCGRKFTSTIRLEHHITNEHTEKPNKYVCSECGKGFMFKSRLDDHMTTHFKKLDYVCHICGVDYNHHAILNKHYRTVHPGETEAGGVKKESTSGGVGTVLHKCRHCDLTSPFKAVIQRHLKTHKEESGNKCEQCGNCYMTEQSLKRHIRLNHPLVKEEIPCPHCLKIFPNVEYMKDHISKFCRLKPASSLSTTTGEAVAKITATFSLTPSTTSANSQQHVSMEVEEIKMVVLP